MIIALCIIALIALLLISPVKIYLSYNKDRFIIKAGISALKITVYNSLKKKQKPQKPQKSEIQEEKKAEKKKNKLSLKKIKQIFALFYDTLKFLKKHLVFYDFKIKIIFGLENAAATVIATGAAWGLLYNIAGLIDKTFKLKKHEVDVKPDFENETFGLNFRCESGLRLFWALAMTFAILKNLNKIKKVV